MNQESLIDNLKNNKDRTEQIEAISDYILNKKKAFSPEKALSGAEIFKEYKNLFNKLDGIPEIPLNTFNIYISKISNSPNSKINCEGRKQGYYIDHLFEKIEESRKNTEINENIELEEEQIKEAKKRGNLVEKDLYQYLGQWLFEVDNERIEDISNGRSQGKWSNPDLVGLKVDSLLGTTEVEVTTIEAKITIANWEQWIFEAVAHTIFSNRSYFSFVHSKNLVNKIPPELKHYAETFRVGILVITVAPEDFLKIQNREKFELTDENHQIIEYYPAPFNSPHVKFKKKFLKGLGINDINELHRFGKALEK